MSNAAMHNPNQVAMLEEIPCDHALPCGYKHWQLVGWRDKTPSERRMANNRQAPPQGGGAIVLDYVDARLADMLGTARGVPEPLLKPNNIVALREDLFERAEMGQEKYGTYLRVNNGRVALVDLYQELLDAVMYSGQVRMETPTSLGANMFEALVNLASQVAGELEQRGTIPAR